VSVPSSRKWPDTSTNNKFQLPKINIDFFKGPELRRTEIATGIFTIAQLGGVVFLICCVQVITSSSLGSPSFILQHFYPLSHHFGTRGVLLVLHCRIGHALVVFIHLVFLTRILDLKSSALFPHITCPRLRSRIVDHGIVVPDPFGVLWNSEILLSRI